MSANIRDFAPGDNDQQINALANLLPDGLLWAAKYIKGTNFNKLLDALAQEFARVDASIYTLASQFIPEKGAEFGYIEEWEEFLGIPDGCLSKDTALDIRRKNIVAKLGYLNLFTKQDYYDLAELYGLQITDFDNSVFGYINITIAGASITPPNILNKFDMLYDGTIAPEGAFIFGTLGELFFRCLVQRYCPAFIRVTVTAAPA